MLSNEQLAFYISYINQISKTQVYHTNIIMNLAFLELYFIVKEARK